MNDGVVVLAEFFELGDEAPDGAVRVVDGAVVDGGLVVEIAITGDDFVGSDDRVGFIEPEVEDCLLYTSPSPRDRTRSRMPSSA